MSLNIYNINEKASQKELESRFVKGAVEAFEAVSKFERDNADDKLKVKLSSISQEEKGIALAASELRDAKAKIKLNSNDGFSQLGNLGTSLNQAVLWNAQSENLNENPLLSAIKSDMIQGKSQRFEMTIESAQAGLAKPTLFMNKGQNLKIDGRRVYSGGVGSFSSNFSILGQELWQFRDSAKTDGLYASEIMAKGMFKVAMANKQRMLKVIVDTIVNNQYTYYDENGTNPMTIAYGRVAGNEYTPATPWLDAANNFNPGCNPIQDFIDWFTDPSNTIIQNTLPFLKGLMMSPETSKALTLFAQNSQNPLDAISFASFMSKGSYDAGSVISANVPALRNVPIIEYDGTLKLEVEQQLGYISSLDFLIPAGYIIPIIDWESYGMGMMMYAWNPRGELLNGASPQSVPGLVGCPQGAGYLRVQSSLMNNMSEDPYINISSQANYGYHNPVSPSTSYLFKVKP